MEIGSWMARHIAHVLADGVLELRGFETGCGCGDGEGSGWVSSGFPSFSLLQQIGPKKVAVAVILPNTGPPDAAETACSRRFLQ